MGAQTKKQLFMEILRFLIVGAIATFVDYFIFWVFDAWLFPLLLPTEAKAWATIALVLSTALGFCVGLLVNWVLSVRFVFRAVKDEERVRSKRSFALFALIGVIGLALTEVGVLTLVAVLPEMVLFGTTACLGTAWRKWLAKVVTTCVVLAFNYLGRKFFIFKS